MGEVVFVIKSLIMTIVVIVCLQIRVGQQTVEGHAMNWIHNSAISQHLQDVAEGAVKLAVEGKKAVVEFIGSSSTSDFRKAERN
jgi:ABC-type molybdate transport system substrate-binding protein